MRLLAPAKINMHLRTGPVRADGFHPLLTWMCTIGLFDNLEVDRSTGPGFRLICDGPQVPCDSTNLVIRAAVAFAEALRVGRQVSSADGEGLSIRLQKRIPVGAGLGGGSSDGARMLQGLNHFWMAGWPATRLSQLAATLGSDLPFFLHGPSAICRGRGELVQPLPPPKPRWALLILPFFGLSTAAVYRRFDEMKLGQRATIEADPGFDTWTRLPANELLPMLVNDLERAAFALEPRLEDLRRQAEKRLSRIVRMSGSGSSLFTLFDKENDAQEAAKALQGLAVSALAVELAPALTDELNKAAD